MSKTKEPKLETEIPAQEKDESPVAEISGDKEPKNETPAKEEPVADENKKKPIEVITAELVVALFYVIEHLVRARNPEAVLLLAERRSELESAIAAAGEE